MSRPTDQGDGRLPATGARPPPKELDVPGPLFNHPQGVREYSWDSTSKAGEVASSGKVGHQSMRQVNRSVVLDLIRETDSISRPELARRSGLTKPTVAAIVEELLREDIVRELGYTDSAGSG